MNYVKIVFSRFKGISYVPEEQYSAHSSDLLPTLDGVGGEKQYPPDVKSIEVSPVAAEICNYRFNKFGALVAREGQYLIYVNIPAIPTRPGFRSPKGCLFIQNYSLIDNVREVVFAEQNITNLLVRGEVWGNERDLPYCWGVVQFMRHNYYNQYYWNRYSYDFPYFRNFIASAIRISSQKQPVEEDGEIVFTLFPVDVIPVNHESAQPLILYGIENSNKVYNVPTGARDPGAFIFYKCFGQDEALRIYDGYAEPDRGYYYWYSIYGLPNADSSILTKSSVVSQVWSAPKRYTETPNINYNEISNPEYSYGAEDIWYKQYFHANQYHGQLIISDPINGDKILTDKYYEILPLQAEGASTVHHDFLMRDNCLIEFPTNIVEIDYCLGEDEENGKGVVTGMGLYRYYLPRNRVETAQVPFVPYWTQRAGQEFGDLHVFQKSFFDWRSVIMQYNPLLNDNERYNILQDSDNYSTRIHKVIYPHSSWGVLMDIIWNDAYEREEYKNTTDMGGIIKCFVINRTKRYILSDVTDDGEFDNILGELSFNNPIGVNKILNERGEIVNYAAADLYKWDDFKIKYYPCSGRKLGREYLMTRYDRIWGRKSSAADKTYLLQDNKNQPEDHVPVVSWYYRFVWDFGNEEFSAPSAPLGVNDIMWSVIKDDIIEQSVYLGQFNDPLQRIKGYREARPFKLSDDDAINSIMYAFDNDTEIDGIDVLADFQYETISERKQTASSALVSPLTDFEYKRLPKLLAFNYNLAVNGERVRDIVNQIYEALYDWYDKNDTVEYLAVTSYVTHQDHFKLLSGNLVEYFRLFVTSDLGGANPEISTFTVQRAGTLGLIVPLYKEEGNSLTYNAVFSDIEVEDENGKTRLGGYYRLAYQRKDNLEPEWIILNNAHVGAYATVPDYPFYIASPIFSDIRVKSGKKYALHDFSGQIVWHGVNYPIVKNAPVHLKIDFTDDDFLEVLPNFESLPANIKNNILGQTKLNGMYYPITGILPYWEAFEDNNNILHSVPDWFRLTYNQFGQPINPPFNLPSWVVALHEDLNSKYVHDIDGLNNGKIEIIDFTNVLHFNVVPVPEDYNNISVSFEESEFGNIWHRTKTTLRFIKSPQKNFERFRDGVPQEVIDRILLRGVAQLVISNFGDRIAHASSAYIMPTSHMMNITDDDGGGVAPQLSRNFIIDRNALDYKYVRSIYDTHNSILSTAYRGANNVNGLFLWRREVDKAEFKGIGGFDDVYITEYDANMLYQGRIRTDHGIGQVFVDFYPNMYKLLYPPLGAPQIYNNMYVNNGAIPLNSKFLFYVYSVFEDNFLIGSLDNIALIPQAHYADVKELRDLYIHDNFKVVLHLEGARLTIPEQITSYIPSSLLFEAPRVKIRIPFNKVPRRARRLLIFRTKSALSNDYHPSKYGLVATVDISKKSFFDSTTGNNFTLNDNIEFFDDVPDSKLDFTYNIEDYNGITTPLKSVTNIVIANRAFYGNVEETYYPPSPPGMNKMPVTMLPSRYVCNYELYGGNIFNRIDAVGSIGIAPLIVYDDDIAEHQAQFNYYWKVDKDAFDNLYADTYNGFIDSSHGCVVYYFACIDKENNISRFRYAFLHRVSIHQDIVNAWDNLQTQRKKLVFAITNMAELWDESLGGIAVYRALLYPDVSYEVLINLPGLPPDAQLELVAYVKNVYDGIIVDYGKVVENQSVPTVWTNYEVRLRLDDYNRNSYVAFPRVEPIKKHYPSTIIYSDVGTTNRIRLYNRIELDEGDGDAIIRMTMAYGNILVFKENSAYRLVITPGTSDIGRIDKLTTEYGLIAPNAIYSNGNDVYFLSNRGLVLYDHNKFERIDLPVSSDISNRLKHHLGIRIQDSTIRDSSIGYNVHYNELYLNIPVWTTKQPDYYYEFADRWGHVFVLNMRYNMWTKFQYMPGDKTYYYKYGEKDRPDNPIIPTWQRSFARIYCTTPNGYLISGEVLPKYHVMVTNIREKVMPTCFYLESPTGLGYDIVAAGIDNTYARDNVLLNRSDGFFYFEHPTESSFSLIVREDVLAIWRSPGFVLGNRTWINRIRKIIVEVNSKKEIVVCNEVKNLALRMKQRSKSVFPIDGQVVFIPDFSEGMDRGNYLNIEVQTKGNSELISIAFYARVTNTWMR